MAFKVLFPSLRSGGLFVIEDLQWQSPFYEDNLPSTHKTSDIFEHWFKTGSLPEFDSPDLAGLKKLEKEIDFALVINQPFSNETVVPKMALISKR